jgi:hypothetical protein
MSTYVPPVAEPMDEDEPPMRSPWVYPAPVAPLAPLAEPLRHNAMVAHMLKWAGEVHRRCGPDGRITTPVPWSERGTLSSTEREAALDWLQHAANMQGCGWVVEYRKAERAWYLNIKRLPEATDLVRALGSTPPPREGW